MLNTNDHRLARYWELIATVKRDGTAETFADIVRQQPLRVLLTLVAIVFLLGLVALPVWLLHH